MTEHYLLVVEDDVDSQEFVSRILRHHRIKHITCGTGEDALRVLWEQPGITGLIIDLALPGIDGWTLLSNVREIHMFEALPCVAITAFHSPELAQKAVEAGFTAYFAKPLDATSFVRELITVL